MNDIFGSEVDVETSGRRTLGVVAVVIGLLATPVSSPAAVWVIDPGASRVGFTVPVLVELDFVTKAENIVFVGPTGVGKTGLATGLLLKALQNGYRGLFLRAQDLFDEMYASARRPLVPETPQPPRPRRCLVH